MRMASPCAACRFATCKLPNLKKKFLGPPPSQILGTPLLLTDDLQLAYKSKTSTVQCISTITEIINYYIKNSSNLYMCTLDCTKAFDRVSLVLLFTKLRERKMNPLVLRCLIYTYCNQKVCINWNGAKSTLFSATNGVKQGGVLSLSYE